MKAEEIKGFRKRHNLTQADLAEMLGVTVTTVRSWEYNQRNISSSAKKLIESYNPQSSVSQSEVSAVPYDNYMVVEYADLSTSAGKLGVDNPAILPKMKKRLIPKEFDNGNYLVVGVDGDSMDDGSNISIPHGTEILIKEYHLHNGDTLPIRNNLFVIVSKTGTVFKQIIEHNTQDGYIVCHSYNPKYKDFIIHLSDVIQIFIYRKIVSFRPSIPEITN